MTLLLAAFPELLLTGIACTALLVGVWITDVDRAFAWSYRIALVGLLLGIVATIATMQYGTIGDELPIARDNFGDVTRITIALLSFVAFVYMYHSLVKMGRQQPEYFVIALFAVVGMFAMVSAMDIVTLYVGTEVMSLALYTLVAMDRDAPRSVEAAMKYFILGAVASAILLFGVALIYGATGSVQLLGIRQMLLVAQVDTLLFAVGAVLVLIGVVFKLGTIPFHMWVPDVYAGAHTAAITFLAGVPKIAAFVLLYRFVFMAFDWLPAVTQVLMVLALLSIVFGNIVAIAQRNIRRMLGYSAIAHAGFVVLAAATGDIGGFAAGLFYVIVYALATIGVFGLLALLQTPKRSYDDIADLAGLNVRSPLLALLLLLAMFSLAGIPVLVGFHAKFGVIAVLIQQGFFWPAVVAVVFSVVGAFYYLRVIKVMYFDAPTLQEHIFLPKVAWVMTTCHLGLLLLLGLFPSTLFEITRAVLLFPG